MTQVMPYRPEVPTVQTLQYRTDIMKARDGSEHRMAILTKPRMALEYSTLLGDDEIRHIRADLFNALEEEWRVPLWHEPFEITADVAIGAGVINGSFYDCDIADDQFIYLDREDGSVGEFIAVTSMTTTAITLTGVTVGAYPAGSYVYPALSAYLSEGQGFARAPVGITEFPFKADVSQFYALGGEGASISTYQSLSLLDRRPLAGSPVEELFHKHMKRIDFGGVAERVTGMTFSDISGGRRFLINTRAELQFWKLFLDTVFGRREPFFFSTWRDDLVLYEQPTPGASTIRVLDDPDYDTEWDPSDAHDDLQIETTDGVIQRRVQSIAPGAADTLVITFTSALPAGSWTASTVSFLEQSHLGSDTVVLTHYGLFSTIDIAVVTAQQ